MPGQGKKGEKKKTSLEQQHELCDKARAERASKRT
jgi:hypothetical protein